MKRPVDIEAQFRKLCLCRRPDPVPMPLMVLYVKYAIKTEQHLSRKNHWVGESNRLLALLELRDAMDAEMAHAD